MTAPAGTLESRLDAFLLRRPAIGKGAYIARGAVVVGDVTIGEQSSVWFNAVLRGDINRIVIGHHTNIQDNAVVHLAEELPCLIGNYVTVGHSAIVHACTVGDEVLVGMGATVLDGAELGEQSVIGANALVKQNARIPPGSLAVGAPARVVRALTAEERASVRLYAEHYARIAAYCLQRNLFVGGPLL